MSEYVLFFSIQYSNTWLEGIISLAENHQTIINSLVKLLRQNHKDETRLLCARLS